MALRHFLTLTDLSPAELEQLIQRAIELKAEHKARKTSVQFPNYVLGMVFEKASTRTRISFEAGMAHLGGHAIFLSPRDTQLGRGEPIEDSAKVISSMCDIVMIRTFEHDIIDRFAANSSVPVINALTDDYHPCQLLADIQTFVENRGSMKGKQVAWIGDGNNMCQSYINAAVMLALSPEPTLSPPLATTSKSFATPSMPRAIQTYSSPTCGPRWAKKKKKQSVAANYLATKSIAP